MNKSCLNCGNKQKIGGVIRCEVTARVKTPPFTPCGNWMKEIKQATLEVD